MAGRWFDASRGAEFWDAERLQVGCLREIVVYNDDGGEVGTAFVMMTRVGKPNPHGALCVVEYLGATRENFYWYWKPDNPDSPGAVARRELVHFCHCCSQECKHSGKVRAPRGSGLQHVSIHREVSKE